MRVTIERFRVLLVAGATLLVLVVVAFLGVARYRSRQLLHDLPAKLGADIEQQTNSFTYSQAVRGRTVFTIHAARAVQRLNGKVTLHDVGIVLYGREQTRADRIYGQEFEYDQKAGVVRAMGEVHLDLQGVAPTDARQRSAYAGGQDTAQHGGEGYAGEDKDPNLIHVRTHALVYEQRTGIASTAEDVEFTLRGVSGRAHGASYDAAKGQITLEREVRLSGVREERPMLMTASHAELRREEHVLLLDDARYVTVGETHDGDDAGQQTAARRVRVTTDAEGRPERVEASEGVTVTNARGTLRAPRATMQLNAAGKPALAQMTGGLEYTADQPLRQDRARAVAGEARFDATGAVERASLTGDAAMSAQTRSALAAAWTSRRDLQAQRVDVELARGREGRRELRQAVASGAVRLELTSVPGAARPAPSRGVERAAVKRNDVEHTGVEQTDLAAEQMTAHFGGGSSRRPELVRLEGNGKTVLERRLADGSSDRSTGDSFAVEFAPAAANGSATVSHALQHGTVARAEALHIARAVQRGGVTIRQTGAARDGRRDTLEAHATEAQFDGEDRLRLVDSARIVQEGRTLEADRIDVQRTTGRLTAEGQVRASYAQAGSEDLVHVAAGRAEFAREPGEATFLGGGDGGAVRAWQGGSQIEAPTLVLRQKTGEVLAYGPAESEQVHTVLARTPRGVGAAGEAPKSRNASARGPVRIASGRMSYREAQARVDFSGGVVLRDGDGTLRSEGAVAYLQAGTGKAGGQRPPAKTVRTATKTSGETTVFPTSGLDRIEASGGVLLQQPGRTAKGDKVVYTAANGEYLLTGAPSSVTDAANGTVQGSAIRFFSGDRSVVVSGDPALGGDGRVRSELKVKTRDR